VSEQVGVIMQRLVQWQQQWQWENQHQQQRLNEWASDSHAVTTEQQ
jgi:hypothetical protein